MKQHQIEGLIAMHLLTGITADRDNTKQLSWKWIDQGKLEMSIHLNTIVAPIIAKAYSKWNAENPHLDVPLKHLLFRVVERTMAGFIVRELPDNDRIKEYITFILENCHTVEPSAVISKVDYFDIKKGDSLFVLSRHDGGNDACNYLKCVLPHSDKVHYLFTAEVA